MWRGELPDAAQSPSAETVGGEMMATRACDRCGDDGWVELLDDDGFPIGATDCPHLNEPWHRPFDDGGILSTPRRERDGGQR